MKLSLLPITLLSLTLITLSPASAGLRDKLKPYKEYIKDTVGEQTSYLKEAAKNKKNKIVEKAKTKGAKVVSSFGVDTIVAKVNGKEIETTDSLLMRLDNMVSAEVILKMIKLMQADMKFQLDRRQANFDQNKELLEKALSDIQTKIEALKSQVSKKIQENISIYQAQIRGRQELVDQAKKTLDEDNSTLIGVVNTLDAVAGNEVIGGIRNVVVRATAAKKGMAQKDIVSLNKDMEKIQVKLRSEQDKLKAALQNPKYTRQMNALMAQSNAITATMGTLQEKYDSFRESDFFNYFDDQQIKYNTSLDLFSQAAGCDVNLKTFDDASVQGALTKLKSCKTNIMNGNPNKPDLPYLMNDTKFKSTASCSSLTGDSDISEVESCIAAFEDLPLTSFGATIVKQ